MVVMAVYVMQVTPNLYGNLVANTAAGIAGGTGVMPGGTRISPILCSNYFSGKTKTWLCSLYLYSLFSF